MSLLVAVLHSNGRLLFANTALENTLGLSRRTLQGMEFAPFFSDPQLLHTALQATRQHDFATLRFEASLQRPQQEPVPVYVSVAATDGAGEVLVELWPLAQQVRQEREERESTELAQSIAAAFISPVS
ncbi:MAG: PAS domain-containing protein, partial [Burkholderiaceae bacterium]|nr:PAS domain-containing protein [Burkholderiaceae bacterium]